jgi:hypothetical protein
MGFGTLYAFDLIELNGDDLRLRRADPLGEWREDDYDALSDGVIVGRIMKAAAAPVGTLWLWTLGYGQQEDRTPTRLCVDARGRDGRVR